MQEVILALLLMHSSPEAVPAKQLSKAIMVTSKRYHVDPVLVTQIILIESRGEADAYNDYSKDHGLMQINEATAESMNLDQACLYNWRCNLDAGVKLLASLKKRQDFRACQYNVGPNGPKRGKLKKCLQYEQKLANMVIKEAM